MNLKKTILVDMDSIIADFLKGILDAYEAETGDRLTEEAVGQWDYVFPNGKDCYAYFSRPGFFRDLKPIPGAIEAIKAFQEAGHEVLIVSSATLTNVPGEKFEWLSEFMPDFKRQDVMFVARKEFVRGDVLIDDYPRNVEPWAKKNVWGKIYTLKYEYNKDCSAYDLRADNWDQIRAAVLMLP